MSRDTACEPCRGTGELGYYDGPEPVYSRCHHCDGDGYVILCDGCGDILEPDYERTNALPGKDYCEDCFADCVRWATATCEEDVG